MSQDETAVNSEVVAQETTVAESAPAETNTPEAADEVLAALSSDEDSTTQATETESEPVEETPNEEDPSDEVVVETETEEDPRGEEKPLAPKSENRFQKLANENRQLREYVEQLNAQVYQPVTPEELINEGYSEEMAEVKALRRDLEIQRYNTQIVEAQAGLNSESDQIVSDFPIFNPDSPDFQADIAADAAEALNASLIRDPNTGQIIGSHISPYQIYKPIADAFEKAKRSGQVQGQKATERMLANVDAPASITPKETKKDPLLAILSSDD